LNPPGIDSDESLHIIISFLNSNPFRSRELTGISESLSEKPANSSLLNSFIYGF